MITEYRVLGGLGISSGILVHVAAFNCCVYGAPRPLWVPLFAVATCLLTFGCVNYAHGKGYNRLLGLTAIIPPVGLVLVSILPDRCKQQAEDLGAPPRGGKR